MSDTSSSSDEDLESKKIKTATDLQRIQLKKLMENPEQEIEIPGVTDAKKPRAFEPHEFVRNVMGASAGAGSGEFDIYRGCRRRQMIREEYIKEQAEKEELQTEFEKKRLENIAKAEERTAKKRQKRLKRKEKSKAKKSKGSNNDEGDSEEDEEDEGEVIDLTEIAPPPQAPVAEAEVAVETTETEIKAN